MAKVIGREAELLRRQNKVYTYLVYIYISRYMYLDKASCDSLVYYFKLIYVDMQYIYNIQHNLLRSILLSTFVRARFESCIIV